MSKCQCCGESEGVEQITVFGVMFTVCAYCRGKARDALSNTYIWRHHQQSHKLSRLGGEVVVFDDGNELMRRGFGVHDHDCQYRNTRRVKFEFDETSLASISELKEQGAIVMPIAAQNSVEADECQGCAGRGAGYCPTCKQSRYGTCGDCGKDLSEEEKGQFRCELCAQYPSPEVSINQL